MEYANEEILSIGYNKEEQETKASFFERNKLLSLAIAAIILLTAINVALIYMFFYILNTL